MRNNKNSVGSNAPFILIIALFIIVFIVVSYFLVSGSAFGKYYTDDNSNNRINNNYVAPTEAANSGPEKQVYNIRDNIFTYISSSLPYLDILFLLFLPAQILSRNFLEIPIFHLQFPIN